MGLEVFAEGELFGESKAVGHFLDGHAGLYEEVLGLVDGEELSRHRRGVEEGSKRETATAHSSISIGGRRGLLSRIAAHEPHSPP